MITWSSNAKCAVEISIPKQTQQLASVSFEGTVQTIPSDDSEKKTNLFNRANRLRMNAEFDKAAAVYESIVAEFPEEIHMAGAWLVHMVLNMLMILPQEKKADMS